MTAVVDRIRQKARLDPRRLVLAEARTKARPR